MKLVRYGALGREKPGMLDAQGRIRDLSKIVPDIAGEVLSPKGLAKLRKLKPDTLPLVRGTPRLGACIGKVGNFIAIGLNYADHAAEAGMPLPTEPLIFNKAPSCICGPNDDTMVPKGSTKLDYEVELGVVIGSRARYLAKHKAMEAVAGYCLANDVSEREWQANRSGQWVKGKSFDTFGPLGPWLVTADELPDPQPQGRRADGRYGQQEEVGRQQGQAAGEPGVRLGRRRQGVARLQPDVGLHVPAQQIDACQHAQRQGDDCQPDPHRQPVFAQFRSFFRHCSRPGGQCSRFRRGAKGCALD